MLICNMLSTLYPKPYTNCYILSAIYSKRPLPPGRKRAGRAPRPGRQDTGLTKRDPCASRQKYHHPSKKTCIYIYIYTYIYVYVSTHIYMYMYLHIYMHMYYIHIYIYLNTYMYIDVYIYIYIHIYTYKQQHREKKQRQNFIWEFRQLGGPVLGSFCKRSEYSDPYSGPLILGNCHLDHPMYL